jgi:hypothetical protein
MPQTGLAKRAHLFKGFVSLISRFWHPLAEYLAPFCHRGALATELQEHPAQRALAATILEPHAALVLNGQRIGEELATALLSQDLARAITIWQDSRKTLAIAPAVTASCMLNPSPVVMAVS